MELFEERTESQNGVIWTQRVLKNVKKAFPISHSSEPNRGALLRWVPSAQGGPLPVFSFATSTPFLGLQPCGCGFGLLLSLDLINPRPEIVTAV